MSARYNSARPNPFDAGIVLLGADHLGVQGQAADPRIVEAVQDTVMAFTGHLAALATGIHTTEKMYQPDTHMVGEGEALDRVAYAASRTVAETIGGDSIVVDGSHVFASSKNRHAATERVRGLVEVMKVVNFAFIVEPVGDGEAAVDNVRSTQRKGFLKLLTRLGVPSLTVGFEATPDGPVFPPLKSVQPTIAYLAQDVVDSIEGRIAPQMQVLPDAVLRTGRPVKRGSPRNN